MARTPGRYQREAARLAERVRTARKLAGLSQEELARQSGLSVGTVRNLEQGVVADPGVFEVRSMSIVLAQSMDTLLADPSRDESAVGSAAGRES